MPLSSSIPQALFKIPTLNSVCRGYKFCDAIKDQIFPCLPGYSIHYIWVRISQPQYFQYDAPVDREAGKRDHSVDTHQETYKVSLDQLLLSLPNLDHRGFVRLKLGHETRGRPKAPWKNRQIVMSGIARWCNPYKSMNV